MSALPASLPPLPPCNFDYVLEVYRLLPDVARARVPLAEYLPILPPPLPAPEERDWSAEPTSPFDEANESQTIVGYTLLAFLLTSERRQRQHHRANGGRTRRRLTQHHLCPHQYDEHVLHGLASWLKYLFARDFALAVKLGLAARRARRASDADLEERCHAAMVSALQCVSQVMRTLSNRSGGGWWMREQLKSVLAEVWEDRIGSGVWFPPDVSDLLRPVLPGEYAEVVVLLLLLEDASRYPEPSPLRPEPEDWSGSIWREDDKDDAGGGTPAALV